MRLIALFLLILPLSACAPHIKTADGSKPGDYQVLYLAIGPSEPMQQGKTRGTVEEAKAFEAALRPILAPELAARPTGRPVGMTITIDEIRLHTNGMLAATLGDSIQAWTTVALWDAQTRAPVGTVRINTISKTTVGLIGVAADAMGSDTPETLKKELVDKYTEQLLNAVYPPK